MRHLARILGWEINRIKAIAAKAARYYDPFDHQAEVNGKWRHIDRPGGELLELQTSIQRRILRRLVFPDAVMGGVRRKSVKNNARVHVRQPELVTLDLRDCFPRILDRDVFRAWTQIGYSHRIAALLTKLTTFQHRLPQGAPTSTLLANLVHLPMFHRIAVVTERAGLDATFWVDDISQSGRDAKQSIEPVVRIVQSCGQAIARKKLKIMPQHAGPQRVTGVVVNQGLSAGELTRLIRDDIFTAAQMDPVPDWLLQRIAGRIEWVRHLNPRQAAPLDRLAKRKLPATGIDGARPNRSRTRPCKHSNRHKRRVHHGAASEPRQPAIVPVASA